MKIAIRDYKIQLEGEGRATHTLGSTLLAYQVYCEPPDSFSAKPPSSTPPNLCSTSTLQRSSGSPTLNAPSVISASTYDNKTSEVYSYARCALRRPTDEGHRTSDTVNTSIKESNSSLDSCFKFFRIRFLCSEAPTRVKTTRRTYGVFLPRCNGCYYPLRNSPQSPTRNHRWRRRSSLWANWSSPSHRVPL